MPDPETQPTRETERTTTIIQTGGGDRGNGGLIAAALVVVLLAVGLFFLFGDGFGSSADRDININVAAPEIDVPDVNVDVAPGQSSESSGNAE